MDNYLHSHILHEQTGEKIKPNVRTSTPLRNPPSSHAPLKPHAGPTLNLHNNHRVSASNNNNNNNSNSYNNNNNITHLLSHHHHQQQQQQYKNTHSTTNVAELLSRVEELQNKLSQLALENEELQFELNQVKEENEQLNQTVQSNELIQSQMRQQLETVTQMAYSLYERFCDFKYRYHKEKLTGPISGGES